MDFSQFNLIPLMIQPEWITQVLAVSLSNGLTLNQDFLQRFPISSVKESTGIINIKGPLTKRFNLFDMLFSNAVSYEQIDNALELFTNDPKIKQIVMLFDSPGGDGEGSFETSNRIFKSREQKKIISVAQGKMASAAYLIGSAAHEIYTSQSSILGSIGVITVHLELTKMAEKMGINATVMRAGKFKALGNQFEEFNELAKEDIQSKLDYLYGMFKSSVSRNLGIDEKSIQEIAEGRVFIGQQAVDAGLAKEIRDLDSLITTSTSISFRCNKEKEMNFLAQVKAALNEEDVSKRDLLLAKLAEGKPKEILATLKHSFNGMQMFKENWDDKKIEQFSKNIETLLSTETTIVKPKTEAELRAELETQFSTNANLEASIESLKKMVLDSHSKISTLERQLSMSSKNNQEVTEKLRKVEILKELDSFGCIGDLNAHVEDLYKMEQLDKDLAAKHLESLRQHAKTFAQSGLTMELGSGQGGNPKSSKDLLDEKTEKYADEFVLAGMSLADALEKGREKAYKENPSLYADVARNYKTAGSRSYI